jgi:ABC-2 type transport system ATP-binding protein
VTVIAATGVSRSFADGIAVDGVDLTAARGEIHAIVGLNGAGKTTLMRLLLGMLAPDTGSVRLKGQAIEDMTASGWSSVGYLIEVPFAYPELTVRENLRVAAWLRGVTGSAAESRVDQSIDRLGLGPWSDKRSRVLSLGNKQRLGLAAALGHRPSVLVLDEPVNALDPAGIVLVRELLRNESDAGAAILVSSHHLDEIARVAHRITVMHRGRIVGTIDPEQPDLERRFFDIAYQADLAREMVI